ncbi:Anti-sigma regulatory factor (Ser/Thr protein kinase) [Amycolatopsis marina]|uniref:Anti-sigma regulatory factor (Ser/Thr protein kinase) n=1 Tax=Amycolatopsis marina TaxID=490629 RepID=A0A1I0ZN08_9PSEU|nr:anti-sigma factor RsbA family regulatory protein [Amycolatopsis marina]SFB26742.1 Anti-sigma regulatory factor (Ser/Thr protein kinase) [Amycolatopsis marina]
MTARNAETGTFSHPALFYRGRDEYLAGTVPFVLDGLAAGEPVAVAVPGGNLDLIKAELGTAAASVHLVNMEQAGLNPGRIIPGVLLAFANQHEGAVRVIGEPIWPGRSELEYPACAQHEALINRAFAGRSATVLCPYDTVGLAAEVVEDAEATHPELIRNDGSMTSASYDPDRIIKQYNFALDRPADAPSSAFDLSGLRDVRSFAVARGTELGVRDELLDDLALIVAELSANSVVHGGGTGALWIWREDDHVVCEVNDNGHLADPLAGRVPARPDQLGGRGLLMVNQIADLVRVYSEPGSTMVRAYLRV